MMMPQYKNEKPEPTSKKHTLTVGQSIAAGAVAGALEVAINHPLWTIKTACQQGQNIYNLSFRELYRGVVPNMASMMPITAFQVGLNNGLQRVVFPSKQSELKDMFCALFAGGSSGFISGPTEFFMTQQGLRSKMLGVPQSFYGTAQYVWANHRSMLFCGVPATAIRDAGFTFGYLSGMPWFKQMIAPYCYNDYVATGFSGPVTGVVSAAVTHPADSIKTVQQSAVLGTQLSISEATKVLINSKQGFFGGLIPRAIRAAAAITIIGATKEAIESVASNCSLSRY